MASVRGTVRSFVLALQFLSVIQIRGRLQAEAEDLPRSMAFYPLVGVILGVILAGGFRLFLRVWPPLLVDFLVVLLAVVLTRALHIDGLADTMDGLLGSNRPERSLEIMKDSALGTFGVVSVVILLLWKFAALTAIPAYIKFRVLFVLPVLGRHSIVQLALMTPYARSSGGLGQMFVDRLSWREYAVALGITAAACVGIAGGLGVVLLGATALLTCLESCLVRWRLGGVTGDVLGAACELNEAAVLLMVAAVSFA